MAAIHASYNFYFSLNPIHRLEAEIVNAIGWPELDAILKQSFL